MRKWFSLTIIAALLLTSLMGSSTRGVAQDRNADATSITPTPVNQEIQLANPVYLPLVASEQGTSDSAQQLAEVVSTAAVVLGEEPQLEASGKGANREDDLSAGQVPPAPGMEPPLDNLDDKANTLEEESIESAAADGWVTIKSEGFEGAFPNTGWRVLDSSGTTDGEYYWDDTSYTRYAGSWSAWPAKGGANALNPNSYNYPNNMRSWMIYGPFDLSNATDANLQFYYWNRSETNYDYFQWLASVNGTNFYGYQTSGDSGGWRSVNFNLKAVPTLGNLTGRSAVWIAFYFISDGSVTYKGPFVDNISLQKLVNTTVNCPNQYKAEYFNNRTLSGSPTVTRCENWPINYNWGNGSPVSGVGSDNFSVRWTGTANMNAGTYTFKATADDGIRAWLDNSLIIDAWRDQGPTEYSATRTVGSGNHSIKIEYYENGGGAVAAFRWDATTTNIPGVTYSTRDGFHVFKVDLWSTNLSYETVMARDAASGNTTNVERVSEMVTRAPYNSRNPVLAFNTDYFGVGHHGAEGLTVKNGVRLPNAGTNNGEEWRRSSLSISSNKSVRIGVQTDCKGPPATACTNWTPNSSAYYNTVGGGPLFIQNGTRIGGTGSTLPCTNESLATSYCTGSFKWTAAGITNNGRYLIVVVSSAAKTMDQAATVLIAEGAPLGGISKAMKFDGGGSTQVWYKPNGTLVAGDRQVTNALVIFSSR